jgi:uncharacterized protein YutD
MREASISGQQATDAHEIQQNDVQYRVLQHLRDFFQTTQFRNQYQALATVYCNGI